MFESQVESVHWEPVDMKETQVSDEAAVSLQTEQSPAVTRQQRTTPHRFCSTEVDIRTILKIRT